MKETWDAKQLVPYIAGPYNQPKAGVENVRSMKYKVRKKSKQKKLVSAAPSRLKCGTHIRPVVSVMVVRG